MDENSLEETVVEPVECPPPASEGRVAEPEPGPSTSGGLAPVAEPLPSISGFQPPVEQTSPSVKRKIEDETPQPQKRTVSILLPIYIDIYILPNKLISS